MFLDILKDHTAFIFVVEQFKKTLKMKALWSFEVLGNTSLTQCHVARIDASARLLQESHISYCNSSLRFLQLICLQLGLCVNYMYIFVRYKLLKYLFSDRSPVPTCI